MSAIEGTAGGPGSTGATGGNGVTDAGAGGAVNASGRSDASGASGAGAVTAPATSQAAGVPVGRLAPVVVWLFVGHAVLGGLYWMLLNVPESNVLMLIASALLAILLVIGAGVVDTTALLWLRPGWPLTRALGRAVRVLPAFLLALVAWVVIWWVCDRLAQYHELHSGELDAWLIAKFDWTRTAWLHRTIDDVLSFLQFIVGTSLAVTLLAIAAAESAADVLRLRWIPRGLGWRQLVIIAVAIYGLIWLPWQAVYWRPAWLPATSAEVVFAVVKLTVLGLLMHLGWTLVLWAPQHRRTR